MDPPRPVVAVACACLLAVAGCSGVVPDDDRARTATLTPASVPDDPAGELAPGIGERRVTDREVAATVHQSVLAGASYRVTHRRTIEDANGTLARTRWNATVDPDRRAYLISRAERSARVYLGGGPNASIAVWYHDGVVRNRFVPADGRPRYWGYDDMSDQDPFRTPTRADEAVSALTAFDYRVVEERTVDGTRAYALRGTRLARPSALDVPPVLTTPRNATLEAVVTEAGVVRSYELRYHARYRDRAVRVRTVYEVSAMGTAAVPRPTWLSAANESVSEREEEEES